MKFQLDGLIFHLIRCVVSKDLVLPRPNWSKISDAGYFKFVNTLKKVNSGLRPTIYDNIAIKHPVLFTKTVHYNNIDQDPIWKWFGKNGNPSQNNCVTTGQFTKFESIVYPDPNIAPSPYCSTRAINIPKTFTGTKQDVEKDSSSLICSCWYWWQFYFGS
ncbi:hypothetical protein CONCODRAFT_4165 [Conidiobolus coronatus NRRL 28638]|uniref:Uncharacterized protein n=1 Tax=Conidiobolus coronatus (strain ATCC 28846 / CBS 209.66 / NRRL 28638) TaxID=796925 RepID=A0A137PDE2_CONC2|nr:hypothetical protein CONCODRAFT_4165 [Conidiobolus coronatus NRRL 28638]|eukprot:KXN73017.1 hypothetical protein CONCODRAFT_4165 [Conidiobolus coronatus NRRL 28638]